MIKVPSDLVEKFEALGADDAATRAKYANFAAAIHAEQREIMARSKALWAEVMERLGLEGEFRYDNGRLYPLNVGPDGAPVELAPGVAAGTGPLPA
jgi:hypothetical protein